MNLFEWFTRTAEGVKNWLFKQEESTKKVFTRIDDLLHKAEPIVKRVTDLVDAEAAALGSPKVLEVASKFLKGYIKDKAAFDKFVTDNTGAPVSNVLHNLAAVALANEASGGTAAKVTSDIDLAVQVAYSVLKG